MVRNGSKDGLEASVTFRSMICPFLNKVKVRSFPGNLVFTNIVDKIIAFGDVMSINSLLLHHLNVSLNTDYRIFHVFLLCQRDRSA